MTPTYVTGSRFDRFGPALPANRLRRAALFCGLLFFAILALFVALPALGQTPDPGADPGAFLLALIGAAQARNWLLLSVLATTGLTWAAKRYGTKVWPWLGTRRGGALLNLSLALVTTLVPALVGGGPLSAGVLINMVLAAIGSSGGWLLLRNIAWGEPKAQVAAEAAKTVEPVPKDATLAQLGAELDKPVR